MARKLPTTMQVYIPNEAKKKEIQNEALARNKSASTLLLEAYEEYLKNHPKGGKK